MHGNIKWEARLYEQTAPFYLFSLIILFLNWNGIRAMTDLKIFFFFFTSILIFRSIDRVFYCGKFWVFWFSSAYLQLLSALFEFHWLLCLFNFYFYISLLWAISKGLVEIMILQWEKSISTARISSTSSSFSFSDISLHHLIRQSSDDSPILVSSNPPPIARTIPSRFEDMFLEHPSLPLVQEVWDTPITGNPQFALHQKLKILKKKLKILNREGCGELEANILSAEATIIHL